MGSLGLHRGQGVLVLRLSDIPEAAVSSKRAENRVGAKRKRAGGERVTGKGVCSQAEITFCPDLCGPGNSTGENI